MTHQLSLLPQVRAEATEARQRVRKRSNRALSEKDVERLAQARFRELVEEYQPKVTDMPASEQPINRIEHYGPGALSTAEILAIIVGGPQQLHLASALLAKWDGLIGLARANSFELTENGFQGIGPVTAARIKAAFELGRRLLIAAPEERPQIKSPADAANLMMMEMSLLEKEHLRTILLDSKNRVLATPTIYVGSVCTAVVRVGELFREAIRLNAVALIVVHNHPSGDPTPSPEDVKVTELIVQAGRLVDVDVLDHMIIGQQRYMSLKERGLGF